MPTRVIRPVPADGGLVNQDPYSSRHYIIACLSVLYLIFTISCSWWYAFMLTNFTANDLLWFRFNKTVQSWIMDAMNRVDFIANGATVDITSIEFARDLLQDGSSKTLVTLQQTLPRLMLSSTNISMAIGWCRGQTPYQLTWLNTLFCWVDFEKRWELGHTEARQERCNKWYATNGAVYMETILRNTNMDVFLTALGGADGPFTISIGAYLQTNESGRNFLKGLSTPRDQSVSLEVQYWTSYNVTTWITQLDNALQNGIADRVAIVPATGYIIPLTVNIFPSFDRAAKWTTWMASMAMANEMGMAQSYGSGLIRGDPTFLWTDDVMMGWDTGTMLIFDALGPLYTIDTYIVSVPKELGNLYRVYLKRTKQMLWDDSLLSKSRDLMSTITMNLAMIKSWKDTDLQYLGGNPLCPSYVDTTGFIQREWGYDDDCAGPKPLRIVFDTENLIFAALMAGPVSDDIASTLCAGAEDLSLCHTSILHANKLSSAMKDASISAAIPPAYDACKSVEIMQMAVNMTNSAGVLLRHGVLDPKDPMFTIIGWSYLLDWIHGTREVVSFEGDVTTLRLISYRYETMTVMEPVANELPYAIANLLFYGVGYVSFLMTLVSMAVIVIACRHRLKISKSNLYFFNRVAGFTWVGRPLLFLRGVTAIFLLSSSTTFLESQNGIAKLSNFRRTFFESMLVAGEATWVTYVLSDVCLIQHYSYLAGPTSSAIVFLAALIFDIVSPFPATISITRDCKRIGSGHGLICQSNIVSSGSFERVEMLLIAVLVIFTVAYLVVFFSKSKPKDIPPAHIVYSGSALAYLSLHDASYSNELWLDETSNIMCGVIYFRGFGTNAFVLDIKSWQQYQVEGSNFERRGSYCSFKKPKSLDTSAAVSPQTEKPQIRRPRFWVLLGFLYIVASLTGSITYLTVLQSKMSNDFWWTNFNTTGGHRFLALALQRDNASGVEIPLDESTYALYGKFNTTTDSVGLYSSQGRWAKHSHLNRLDNAITGLRQMDGCLAPWIAAQYCWVDFDRKWEMASSLKRQQRCALLETTNAAVYLEAVLRNIDQIKFMSCWSTSFEIAISRDLKATLDGQNWLARSTNAGWSSVDKEVEYWRSKSIVSFVVQWQNYKVPGFINVINVENAFGVQYPLTLQSRNGTWRVSDETSRKMYWSFAGDLWAVAVNRSGVSGSSLIRSSSRFLFQNVSSESLLRSNGTLPTVDPWAAELFKEHVGPYGNVDVTYITPPFELIDLIRTIDRDVNALLYLNATVAKNYSSITSGWYFTLMPAEWQKAGYSYYGGTPLCFSSMYSQDTPFPYIDILGPCTLPNVGEGHYVVTREGLIAALAADLITLNSTEMCSNVLETNTCKKTITLLSRFISLAMPNYHATIHEKVTTIHAQVHALNISLFQYVMDGNTPAIVVSNIFSKDLPGWKYWSWTLMREWGIGGREAVRLQGEKSELTVLSTSVKSDSYALNALETPQSLSLYFMRAVQYVTIILLIVAGVILLYIISSRGHVEPTNLYEINRVGAIVWVGRPLLLLRAVSAMALLSTGQLQLRQSDDGLSTAFKRPDVLWFSYFQEVIVSGEVCWFTYILHDVLSIWTRGYTKAYADNSFLLTWFLTSVIQIASPQRITTTLDNKCVSNQFDFEFVCTIGTISVGRLSRLGALVGLNVGCILFCLGLSYLYLKHIRGREKKDLQDDSQTLFLYSLASQLFPLHRWTANHIVYLDKASALLNGLVVVQFRDHLYMLDVKTWRTFNAYRPPRLVEGSSDYFDLCVPMSSEWQYG